MKRTAKNDDKEYVTKGYLREVINDAFEIQFKRITTYIDFKVKPLEEMRLDYYKWKDHVNKTLDWLVGAYKRFEEKHEFITARQKDTQGRLDNHENRIMSLEVDRFRKNKSN